MYSGNSKTMSVFYKNRKFKKIYFRNGDKFKSIPFCPSFWFIVYGDSLRLS
ncbi:hypothetical protein BpHYR1_003772 [Brachionus plicatilis]|uniref:Uncharacterized protein n=1 Tax=Brachionus plicatilis TaxID=10195 RepID=A0A3M7QD11_BRAPC|nr:hypothetical protein BpHYR1_003772 [Brachionus plicatilis]